jgi:hypothetical protein
VRIVAGSWFDRVALWVGGDSFESATVFDLQAGEQTAGIEIKESGILCHLDWPDHDAEYDVSVILTDPQGRQIHPYRWSSPGSIGIIGLSPGRYFLRLEHGCQVPWAPAWYDSSETLTGATPIDIATWGETVEITMHLVQGGRIEGAILPSPREAPSAHRVLLLDSEGASICESVSDESFGEFAFLGLVDGVYRVAVSLSWNERWWYPGTADPDSAGTITVTDHATVSGIEWRMP